MQEVTESSSRRTGRGPLRILIAGGGTGGHIVPGLAIAREMRDAHGSEILFVGTARGLETRMVPDAGFALELIQVGQLKNVSWSTRLRTLVDLPLGVLRCVRLLHEWKPSVVVGVGGYASGPAMMAAVLLRMPTLAFEPNAVPGLANRIVGKMVSAAAVNLPETVRFFHNATVTGIPVRPAFTAIGPRPERAAPRLLVMGGSQGARALNTAMVQVIAPLLSAVPGLTVVHQAGERHAESTHAGYAASGADPSRWRVAAFVDSVAEVAEADLVLCRSGASTVAELCAAGRPALFVPFPQAADDHQTKNAEAVVRLGAAEMLAESSMTPDLLLLRLAELLGNRAVLTSMAKVAREAARPDALQQIAAIIQSLS